MGLFSVSSLQKTEINFRFCFPKKLVSVMSLGDTREMLPSEIPQQAFRFEPIRK